MKDMDLMRAMTDIDEEFIEEAAPREKTESRRLILPQAKQWMRAGALMAVLVLSFTFASRVMLPKGSSVGPAPLQQSAAENNMDSVPAEAPAAAGGMLTESASEEAENAPVFDISKEPVVTAAVQLSCPEEFGEFRNVEITYGETETEAVYRNENGETGLRIIRRSASPEEYANPGSPVIEEKNADARSGKTFEAEWTEGGFTYHIIVAGEISEEELQKLIEEIY